MRYSRRFTSVSRFALGESTWKPIDRNEKHPHEHLAFVMAAWNSSFVSIRDSFCRQLSHL